MMSNTKPLETCAHIVMGQSPDSSSYNETNGISFLQGCSDFGRKSPHSRVFTTRPNKIAKKYSTLISVRAPVGTTNIANREYCIGRGLASIFEISGVSINQFLHYAIQNAVPQLLQKAQGSTFEAISSDDLRQLKVYCPDLPAQKRIATILSTVDGQIEKTEAIIAKYQAIKQGMLHDLFTRGIDLATGKLRPTPEQAPELYKQSPSGLIPKDWSVGELVKYCSSNGTYGINAAAVDYSNELPTYLRITDISENGEFISIDKKSVNHPLSNNYLLSSGDIVFARTGASVGKTYLYNPVDGKLIYAGFLIKFSPREDKLLPKFLKLITELPYYKNWVTKTSMRSGQPGINGQEYGSFIVQLPDIEEQSLICSKINSLENLLTSESSRLKKLQKIKQGLMSKLLNGDL